MDKSESSKKKILIIGISGQDGAFLSKYLHQKGYQIIGSTRNKNNKTFEFLKNEGILNKIKLVNHDFCDFEKTKILLESNFIQEIYNLSGQTSVGLSHKLPIETFESFVNVTLNILEAIRVVNKNIKYFNASSAECFGNCLKPANEKSSFNANSPYSFSKATAYMLVKYYRESHSMFCVSGILSNHESKYRNENFVTKKIIKSVVSIYLGKSNKLALGNTEIIRDWGYAKEYCEAMNLMLDYKIPEDFILATGKSISLIDFVKYSFKYLDMNYKNYLIIDENLKRPIDNKSILLDPRKAYKLLKWKAKTSVFELIELMIEEELLVQKNISK
jgi:GDPmannose 4,6-dehydratase